MAEVQFGKPIGVAVGTRAFDVVEPTESWQMENGEVGLASVVLRRDFRDYYGRHGADGLRAPAGRAGRGPDRVVQRRAVERRAPARTRGRSSATARPGGRTRSWTPATCTCSRRGCASTRGSARDSVVGVVPDRRRSRAGSGRLARLGSPLNVDPSRARLLPTAPEHVDVHARILRRSGATTASVAVHVAQPPPRHRRMARGRPAAHRAEALARRPGTLPGYGFRESGVTPDVAPVLERNRQAGTPAQCDRIALVQVELRSRVSPELAP